MAALTRWQIALRSAQIPVANALKSLGFRKSGNYFNRPVCDQLVQVVGFQSGQAVSILHGNFTVNLGVYIPCIAELEGDAAAGRYVTDAHCEIRSRLSDVAKLGKDKWWPLDQSSSSTGLVIAKALVDYGVPFLDRYRSFDAVLERFAADRALPFHNAARSTLAAAIIQWSRGELDRSRELFQRAETMPPRHAHFSSYVSSVRTRCGL